MENGAKIDKFRYVYAKRCNLFCDNELNDYLCCGR